MEEGSFAFACFPSWPSLLPGYAGASALQLPIQKGRFASEAGLNSFVPSFELLANAARGADKRQATLDLTPLRPS